MKKFIKLLACVLLLSTCIYLYIRNQSNHSKTNITNIIEESTQSITSPPNQQASQQASKEPSQQPSPTLAPPQQNHTVTSEEAVNCLSKKEREYNQTIIDNLLRLQELAKLYCQKSGATQSEEFLMASFLRCGEERYMDKAWSNLAGDCVEFSEFIKNEDNNQAALDLQKTKFFHDPVTGEEIDFTHLMATLNTYLNQDLIYQLYPEVGDIGGWAGDCIQLAAEAKKAQVQEQELESFMNGRLGVTGKFGMGDILADIDALNIYEKLEEGADLPTVWEAYYSSLGKNTRYNNFTNHRFPEVTSEDQLKQEILRIVAPEYSLAMFKVYHQEGLEQEDKIYSRAAGVCFAEYLWKLQ